MSDLKRCPFCGLLPRTAVKVTQMSCYADNVDFSVVCEKCGTSKTFRLGITKETAFLDVERAMELVISAWNQRAEEKEE